MQISELVLRNDDLGDFDAIGFPMLTRDQRRLFQFAPACSLAPMMYGNCLIGRDRFGDHRIEVADRRSGEPGSFARGFFVWNSEVGKTTLGIAFFLFDYVCCNRIVWGARDFTEIRVRHTSGAPDRWLEEVQPVLIEYAQASARPIVEVIESAKQKRLDDLDKFLGERFGKRMTLDLKEIHLSEEHRPIETLWDATTAVTARARLLPFQDQRVELEREAGRILQLAA